MTIDEAIKRLEVIKAHGTGLDPGSELSALKLGIEALKEAQRWRSGQPLHLPNLLPGETAE